MQSCSKEKSTKNTTGILGLFYVTAYFCVFIQHLFLTFFTFNWIFLIGIFELCIQAKLRVFVQKYVQGGIKLETHKFDLDFIS